MHPHSPHASRAIAYLRDHYAQAREAAGHFCALRARARARCLTKFGGQRCPPATMRAAAWIKAMARLAQDGEGQGG